MSKNKRHYLKSETSVEHGGTNSVLESIQNNQSEPSNRNHSISFPKNISRDTTFHSN